MDFRGPNPPERPNAGSDRGRRMPQSLVAVLGAYLAAYVLWHLTGSADEELVGGLAFLSVAGLAAYASWRAGERAAAFPRMRWGWRLIAFSLVSYALGGAAQLVYELQGELPTPSIADFFYLGFYPLFLAGILRFPWGAEGVRTRRQAVLDAATIAVGGGAIVWYLVLGPTAYADGGSLLANLIEASYPIGDLVLIGALARLWTAAATTAQVRRSLAWLSVGVGLFVVGDVAYSWTALHSTYVGGGWLDLLWIAATIAFVLAPASQPVLEDSADADPKGGQDDAGTRMTALPYLAVVVVFGLLIGTQAKDTFFPGLSLTLVATAIAGLVLARQFLAARDLTAINSELHQAHAELAALATTDPLTALPNHRALVGEMDRELARAIRYERPCSVLFIDIDYFKALNDGFGHAAGDTALRELAPVMEAALRKIDTLGRWGGEEFVAVLPEIGEEAAIVAAERVRVAVADHVFGVMSETHLTISIGTASYPRDGDTRGAMLEAADRAMYAAKRMGRNQVLAAGDPSVGALRTLGGADFNEHATMGAVDMLATLIETSDRGIKDHVTRVAELAERVALSLGCSPEQAREIYFAAKLHDIGKVGVADSILRKPMRLNAEEWELMRKHPSIGANVVSRVGRLEGLAPIIHSHHERFDGGGYPEGLHGEEIPLEARIVSAADAFDAMTNDRPYRGRLTLEEAREELSLFSGTQFDPEVVAALEGVLDADQERTVA